ncbi:MAG: (2Fe-2S) ferredoxin domain-containing protein [Chlorobi bacterium]|nr:(2Fe-2S) ferredoxin domain-containing protein [Chlorobiota bacterium]
MKRFDKHIFVCVNFREKENPKGSCGQKGSEEIRSILKKKLKERKLNISVRANASGCLAACENGPAIVVYPEQIWYGRVSVNDLDEIIESHIINGIPVKRLLIAKEN